MKLQKVSQTITPFAGISFVHEEFNMSGLSKLIDNYLGIRNTTGYSYGKLFRMRLPLVSEQPVPSAIAGRGLWFSVSNAKMRMKQLCYASKESSRLLCKY